MISFFFAKNKGNNLKKILIHYRYSFNIIHRRNLNISLSLLLSMNFLNVFIGIEVDCWKYQLISKKKYWRILYSYKKSVETNIICFLIVYEIYLKFFLQR